MEAIVVFLSVAGCVSAFVLNAWQRAEFQERLEAEIDSAFTRGKIWGRLDAEEEFEKQVKEIRKEHEHKTT